jgi:hypothetical protein
MFYERNSHTDLAPTKRRHRNQPPKICMKNIISYKIKIEKNSKIDKNSH